jgi:hypothetical protein
LRKGPRLWKNPATTTAIPVLAVALALGAVPAWSAAQSPAPAEPRKPRELTFAN